jgi:hypothetical protein
MSRRDPDHLIQSECSVFADTMQPKFEDGSLSQLCEWLETFVILLAISEKLVPVVACIDDQEQFTA